MLIDRELSCDAATFNWHVREVSHSEWRVYWVDCAEQNLLQSWEYGDAKEQSGGWTPKRLVIFNQDNLPIALVQVLIKCIPVLGGIARINRGPLLFDDDSINYLELKLEALKILMVEGRRRRWWVIQIAPEICDSYEARVGLQKLGLRKQKKTAWASSLMDLSLSIDDLYSNLNRRWKRALIKASKLGLIVKTSELTEVRLAEVLKSYANLQTRNQFVGIDGKLIMELSKLRSPEWNVNLFVAELEIEGSAVEEVGYRVTIHNGRNVLDFLVSTNSKGRLVEANSALYWHAIVQAKQIGSRWFDVGGLSAETPKGIADFKKGLNGTPYQLIGEWRKWF
jgi:lipid II:glycine glycyltransferase (peptidoglycan interpeptide bridge formation enzyme)